MASRSIVVTKRGRAKRKFKSGGRQLKATAADKVQQGYVDNNPKTVLGSKKVSLSKVPASAIIYEALAMQDGANKYGPYNWRKNHVTASIYIDACKRHIDSWFDGEQDADDSQVPHLGHARACLGILIDAIETGNVIDDRPPPGAASALLARYTKKDVK